MKKIISLIVSLALVVTTGCFHVHAYLYEPRENHPLLASHWTAYKEAGKFDITAEKTELLLGDATIDGTVDASDALFALIYGLDMPSFDETVASDGKRVSHYNLYYWGFTDWPGKYGFLTKACMERKYQRYRQGDRLESFTANSVYYQFNSALMADVSNDGFSNAVDALLILQYAVGKIDAFPRTDFSSKGCMFYVPWFNEWEPGMIWNDDIEEKCFSGYYSAFQ